MIILMKKCVLGAIYNIKAYNPLNTIACTFKYAQNNLYTVKGI